MGRQSKIPNLSNTLSIFVYQSPQLSVESLPVRPDGKITLPMIGDVMAEGRTAKELQKEVTTRLAPMVSWGTNPEAVLPIGARTDRIHLGLDLRGGTHLVLQVHTAEAVAANSDNDLVRAQRRKAEA